MSFLEYYFFQILNVCFANVVLWWNYCGEAWITHHMDLFLIARLLGGFVCCLMYKAFLKFWWGGPFWEAFLGAKECTSENRSTLLNGAEVRGTLFLPRGLSVRTQLRGNGSAFTLHPGFSNGLTLAIQSRGYLISNDINRNTQNTPFAGYHISGVVLSILP